MHRGWLVVLALSVGLNLGLLGGRFLGDEPRERGRHRPDRHEAPFDGEALVERHLERMVERLELTDDQRTEIGTLLRETLPVMMEHRDALEAARDRLSQSYAAPALDDAAFRAAAAEVKAAQGALDSLTADVMLREAGILTPEQREENSRRLPWKRGPFGRSRH
jgi:Spy/CpxP family protein refolding chaperone